MWSLLLPSGREASRAWGECTYVLPCTICENIHPRERAYMDTPTHLQMDTQTHPYTIANTCNILYSQIQPPDQVASTYPHSQHACPSHTLLHRQHAAYSTDVLDWVHKVYSKLFVTGKPTLAGQTLFSMLQSLQCSLRLMKCEYIHTFGPKTGSTVDNVTSQPYLLACPPLVQWNLSIEDTTGTPGVCSVWRGVPTLEVDLYTGLCGQDCRQRPHKRGVPYSECPLQRISIHCTSIRSVGSNLSLLENATCRPAHLRTLKLT